MNQYLILARYQGESPSPPPELLDGNLPTIWSEVASGDRTILVCQFASREAAEEQLRTYNPVSIPLGKIQTPDIRGVAVSERKGFCLEHEGCKFLSLVSLNHAPGMGPKVEEENSMTPQSIELMPGYEGHSRGVNTSLEEEHWVLVFWES